MLGRPFCLGLSLVALFGLGCGSDCEDLATEVESCCTQYDDAGLVSFCEATAGAIRAEGSEAECREILDEGVQCQPPVSQGEGGEGPV
ncbi:MAG: hypothetical protein R3B72_20640 [Polyangiaceae bacterium]